MAYVKIVFRSIDDLSEFIRQNKLGWYEMFPAEYNLITEEKPYVLPTACTLIPLTDVNKKAPQHLSGTGTENSNA